jgi:hypothetical protein
MSATTQFSVDLAQGLTPDTVTIRAKASTNSYGEPAYVGTGTTYNCYVQKVRFSDRRGDQEQDIVEYKVYIFSPTLTVDVEDEIALADNIKRPIVTVDYRRDEYKQQAVVIALGAR